MTTSTSFAQVANNLLNVLQGYTKGIRLLLVMFLTLTVTTNAWGAEGDTFTRISAASDLSDGDEIIFVDQEGTYACGTKQNSNNRTPVAITTSSNSYSYKSSDNVQVFIVKVNGSNYGFHNGSGYIYSASSSNNYLNTNTTASTTAPSGTAAWTLSVSDNVFTVKNASNTNYYLAFNGTSYFSQYKSGQSKPYIYKKNTAPAVKHKAYFYNGTTLLNTGGTEFAEGAAVSYSGSTPTSCDGESVTFVGWATSTWEGKVAKGDITPDFYDIIDGEDLPEMGTADVTYHAVFAKTSEDSSGDYKLVTSLSNLKSGVAYLGSQISYSGVRYYYMSSTAISSNLLSISNATVSSNILQTPNSEGKINLVSTGTANQYYIKNAEGKYLYSNAAGSLSWSTTACSWTFSNMNSTTGLAELTSSANSNIKLRAYGTSTTQGKLKTYSGTTNNGICVFLAEATTTYSDYITTCTTETSQLATPTNLQSKNITSTSADLFWEWPEKTNADKLSTYYLYIKKEGDANFTGPITYSGNSCSRTGLDSETKYIWKVQAISNNKEEVEDSEESETSEFTTLKACTDAVNFTKGTPSNGSFTMVSGNLSTCNGPVTVTLSNIEPAIGYQFSTITQTGVDDAKVTIDNNNKTVTYAKNTTGNSIINVTFIEIPKHTVTLNPNYPNGKIGTFKDKAGNIVSGNLVLTYDYNTASMSLTDLYQSIELEGYQFNGWYSATSGGSLWTSTGKITRDVTVYAQWSKLYSITLSENGTTTELTPQTSTSYTLPTGLSVGTCENGEKELVGWSTVEIPNPGDKPTSKFYELGETATLTADQTTFYAVFATVEETTGGTVDATLSFASTAQRDSQTSSKQVWSNDGITFTNNKGDATTNVADYSNPVRLYKNSEIIVEHTSGEITKIVFDCNSSGYATALENSIGTIDGVTISTSSDKVTITFENAVESFSAKLTSDQVRLDGITVTTGGGTTTTYSDYTTTCVKLPDPVISFVTTPADPIVFDPVNCGSTTSKAQAKTVQVSGANLQEYVSVEVTGPYKIARTSYTNLSDYTTSLTLDKTNTGTINSTIYIISCPPAQSTNATTGTLTFTTKKGNTLTVNLSTPTVNCTTYALTFNDRGNKTVENYYAGVKVPQPADPTGVCTEPIHYVFDGWAEATVANGSTEYTKVTFPYTMPGQNKTLYAVYRYVEEGSAASGDYVKVTENLDDYSGDYLIVYETGSLALNGALVGDGLDASGNSISVTITDNTIVATDEVNASNFTIAKEDDGYSIRSASGYYIGQTTNANDLKTNSTEYYANTITLSNDDNADVVSSGAYLRYNAATGNTNLRFRYYKSDNYTSQKAIALYRKAASYLYTTSPACGPMLEITSGKDIYVTSGYGTGRNTVIAQQTVEYRATRLKTQNGSAEGTAPDVKVAANGITIGGEVTDKVKVVELTQNKELIEDKYTITGTVTLQYTPTASNLQEEIQVQLAVDYNSEAKDNFTVHARSLPAEFVIAAKQGEQWYALNADMSGSDAEKANNYLQVDNIEDPTEATFAPCNTIYTFDGMVDGGNKEYMRFQGIDGKYLWAASAGNTGIQNYAKNTPTAGTIAYNWQLYTSDNETYQLQNEGNGRKLGLSKDLNFGMYSYVSTLQQDIRILPYKAKCLYNYAPSNLKVSVLKGTSVTLTWDAVPGATKYQYSTDAINWTDAGTEPTVTINGLEGKTKYTYYVRAYHEDAGVSQECIDYEEITFTTADCDDVPTDIAYTADFNSITVSWTAAAPTATIKLYTNADGTGGSSIYPSAKSPYKISGGLDKNTTYYIQIFSDGTCASPIIPVKTKDVEVDIVEWKTDGIVVDINTNENISVTLENEVSYGSNVGAEATELFFSKYYEASYNVKLVAIYNGTKNIIDLTDYIIKYGKTSWESNYITLKDFGATKGQIQPGEEIILYSMQDGTQDDEIMDCVHEDFPDGNWVEVTSSNNTGKGILSFAGDKTLALFKGKTIIDIIGAVNGSTPNNSKANEKPKWGDAKGWICATGLSLADDSEIGISTNRCLLVRNNTVTSGANAVTSNTTDFVTLCSEWKGAHVLDSDVDNGIQESCENFAYVGTFDYSDYYTKYVPMGNEKIFDENARNADGTVTIPITDLNKQSCRNIRIIIKDNNTKVISNQEYKVPIMITTTQGTDGEAFLALQENLATVEVDANDQVVATHPLLLDEVREICKTCDVVVRDNATLMKMADDAANDHPQVRNIYVYENSSLIVPNGTNYTINNLSLRRKEDAVASVSAYPEALKLPESAATPISLDFRLSAENWHWFTLPYDCNISEVTWVDGSPAQYNVDWFLMTYDGEKRAATQAGGCWKAYTGTTINAGDGFIIAINGNINNPAHTYELRFPMSKDVLVAEGSDKTVDVRAWGVETNIRPNHKGWNLVGNPYLAYYQRNNITNFEGLRLGQLTGPDTQTGYWKQTGDVPYVVVPVGAGWIAYEQVLASETDLLPFTAYFVQVGKDGTHTSEQDLKIAFDHTKLQLSATPMPASIVRRAPREVEEIEEPIIVRVELTNSKGESDKTSLVIDQRFTNEYEMNGDFFKWFGDYYNYYTKPVLYTIGADQGKRAFNALNEDLAKQPIPMGMYAAQAGNYTFSLNQQFDLSRVEEVWLYDATQSTYTNLMQSDYTFSTSKVNGAGRFSLSVKLAPKVATGMDNVSADKVWATTHTKQVIVNGLENGMHLWLYDATGKLLYTEPTSNYQHTYVVPQTGTYFVSVVKGNAKQTIKVVVE